jgi:hypothetical protein
MMADIEVLTKYTAQVTAGKEYCPRPAPADKLSLLAEVRPNRADQRRIADSAKAYLPFAAVNFALARAECAGIHTPPQLLNALAK